MIAGDENDPLLVSIEKSPREFVHEGEGLVVLSLQRLLGIGISGTDSVDNIAADNDQVWRANWRLLLAGIAATVIVQRIEQRGVADGIGGIAVQIGDVQ